MAAVLDRFYGTGRRKTSVARVWIKPGSGHIVVNRRAFEDYFPRETLRMIIAQPLAITNTVGQFDVLATVKGGGATGQARAVPSERLAGEPLGSVYPHLRGLTELVFHDLDAEWLAGACDVAFLALPHMESQKVVPVLRKRGRKVIDLSADYRLHDAADYTTWYKTPHVDPTGLAEAVYGLPELHRKAIAAASLIACPGCYAAGAVLATAPLLHSGLGR